MAMEQPIVLNDQGIIEFYPRFFQFDHSLIGELIQSCSFKQNRIYIYGRDLPIPRLEAWYGTQAYTYSGHTLKPSPWFEQLSQIKRMVEERVGIEFNSCLANLYRDGRDYVSWHRDNEKELGENPLIASISIGESRRFSIRKYHDKTCKKDFTLNNGDLLIMRGEFQQFWEHQLAKTSRIVGPRINFTFRQIF